jgi:aryl-alcohol dehydrogenase-like predicted oxidoreductase
VQVQYSLLDRRPENGMTELCKDANIKLLPFGTVAGGFFSEKYVGFPADKCAAHSSLVGQKTKALPAATAY